ncbi:MAG: hypothetical protein IT479_08755 [Xanthomonadales bacterium]|nr:hypothetical protein [Xanthomonadales bacterium]MCC6593352.1 hypothetical protein [Xanthomonadales bacterium]
MNFPSESHPRSISSHAPSVLLGLGLALLAGVAGAGAAVPVVLIALIASMQTRGHRRTA